MRLFSSDHHFGHLRIIEYAQRPFRDIHHMREELVRRWNEAVAPEDVVIYGGDWAMGHLEETVPVAGRCNGYKVLLLGNHDGPWEGNDPKKRHQDLYQKYFDEIIHGPVRMEIGRERLPVIVSHFPYAAGDVPRHADKYNPWRPDDEGLWLVHGHTHAPERINVNARQVHVGVDAWDYTPVPEQTVADLILAQTNETREERV